jgi:hypothetical protein
LEELHVATESYYSVKHTDDGPYALRAKGWGAGPKRQWPSLYAGRSARSRQRTQSNDHADVEDEWATLTQSPVRSCCAETWLLTVRYYLRRKS